MKKIISNSFVVKSKEDFEEWALDVFEKGLISYERGTVRFSAEGTEFDDFEKNAIEIFQKNLKRGSMACLIEVVIEGEKNIEVRCLLIDSECSKMIDFKDYILEDIQKYFWNPIFDLNMLNDRFFEDQILNF